MTKTCIRLSFLLCLFFLYSCSENENEKHINGMKSTYLELSDNKFYFEAIGGEQTMMIETDGNWYIDDVPSWILIDKTKGTGNATITLKLNINTKEVTRKGYFIVYSASNKRGVEVKQLHTLYKTDAFPTSFHFDKFGGRQTLKVTSNSPWVIDSIPSWLNISYNSVDSVLNEVKLSVKKNIFTDSLSGYFFIKGRRDTLKINVSQEIGDKTLDINPPNFYIDGKGIYSYMWIASSDSWSITSEIPEWISINKTSGRPGWDTLIVKINDSQGKKRSSVMTFDNKFIKRDVKFEQAAEKIVSGKAAFFRHENLIYKGRYPYGDVAFNIDGKYIYKGRTKLDGVMFTIDGNKIRKSHGYEIAFIIDGPYLKKPNGEIAFTLINNYIVMGRNK